MIWQLTDEHALALTEAYRAATAELLLAQQQRRSALVEALVTGHPGPEAGPWEAAALLGLPSDGHLVVVAADTRSLAEESLPGIERRLAARGIVSGWRLTPAQQLGMVSLHADQRSSATALWRGHQPPASKGQLLPSRGRRTDRDQPPETGRPTMHTRDVGGRR